MEEKFPSRDTFADFDHNPLSRSLKDEYLKSTLRLLMKKWREPKSDNPLWNPTYCKFMLNHGLEHIKNVFILAGRLYDTVQRKNKDFLKDDKDKFRLIASIWLHDYGNAGPQGYSDFREVNEFLKKEGGYNPEIKEEEIEDMWVRKNHALLSWFNINYGYELIDEKRLMESIKDGRKLRCDIANLCFYHSSRTPLTSRQKGEGKYDCKSLEEKDESLLGLCALLRILDSCDETWYRVAEDYTEYKKWLNALKAKKAKEKIENTIENFLGAQKINASIAKKLRKALSSDDVKKAIKISESMKAKNLRKKIIEYKGYRDAFPEHVESKMEIWDVFFNQNDEIILVPFFRDYLTEKKRKYLEETVIKRIKQELEDAKDCLKKLGLSFTVRLWEERDGNPKKWEIKLAQKLPLMKALIISVGTGVRPTQKAVESLANAISFSIRQHNPDKTFFIVSQESQKRTLPKILHKTKLKNYKVITIKDPDNIQQIYETLQPKFKQIRQQYEPITVDYTSGTKAMTGTLTILGTTYEVNTLSYITGKRKGGIVLPGTERISIIQPYFATAEQKIKTAIQFFNQNQFSSTITILNQIEKTTTDTKITNRIKPLKNLAKAYGLWGKFQHQKTFQTLRKIEKEELNQNKRFLGQLFHAQKPEPYYIADLINNAKRRATDEKRYDDAVSRLYRTIELIAQYQLKTKYNIKTSAVKPTDIPEELMKKWNVNQTTPKIRIGLEKAYELLSAKNDSLGKKFTQDKKLRNLLNKRNTSILAHNLKPVNQKICTELYQKTIKYASSAIKNLNQLMEDSAFIKWVD